MISSTGPGPLPKDVTHCRACGAHIVFVRTKKGKLMPINVNPTSAEFRAPNAGELAYVHKEHQPHFLSCPKADEFRQRGRSRGQHGRAGRARRA